MADPEETIEEDVGGVQGADEGETMPPAAPPAEDGGTGVQAPDAGEIEWAGGLVKKAPGDGE